MRYAYGTLRDMPTARYAIASDQARLDTIDTKTAVTDCLGGDR
jgi:hypothetical protein